MEELILAQCYYENKSLSKEKKIELLKKINVNYSIPDIFPGSEVLKKLAGYTSLHFAVQINDLDDFAIELLAQGANPVKQGNDGCTPLHLAVDYKSLNNKPSRLLKCKLIDSLLSRQVEIKDIANPNKCEQFVVHTYSHLHIACIVNHAEAVEFFVKAKVDLNLPISNDACFLPGYTALHCAIECSSVEAADILLQHDADVNVKNESGLTCLHLLLQHLIGINDMIKMGKRKLYMPYKEEAERLETIIKSVLKFRANDETVFDDTGLSALHLASTLRDKLILKKFLTKHTHVNMPVKSDSEFWPGWTPLHFAACSNIETMLLLMQNGGNILMKNLKGESALDLCAKRFASAEIQLLLSKETKFKDIVLSDNQTMLSELLLVMNNYDKFSEFMLKLKDVNLVVPSKSPIWPGYNLLHLSVCLNEKTKLWEDFEKKFEFGLPEKTDNTSEHYNCTEDEEILYCKRIELCLEYGCNVNAKNVNEQTPIHLAFSTFRKIAVEQLLNNYKKNILDGNDLSLLHIACTLGNIKTVKTILRERTDVNCKVKSSFDWHEESHEFEHPKNIKAHSTPLHVAVVFGHNDVVEFLLKNNADVYAQDSFGFTPIHLVEYSPMRDSIAKLLFNATPNLRDLVSSVGLSHLHIAAFTDNKKAVDELLLNGANLEQVIDKDVKQFPFLKYHAGSTPLVGAGEETIESLLKAGANMNAKNCEGDSALRNVLYGISDFSSKYFISLVKSRKYKVELCGMTLLHVACGSHDIKWIKKLIKNGADVNAQIQNDQNGDDYLQGATPLHMLLKQAFMIVFNRQEIVDMVKLLIDNGADLTIESDEGTPLHLIYQHHYRYILEGDPENAEFFLLAGDLILRRLQSYEINPVNSEGFSHFHFACLRNDSETAKKFLDHGVNVNTPTDLFANSNAGLTPLHFAMALRCRNVAHLLLEKGADVNAEDVFGNKPLHVAMRKSFIDLNLIGTMISLGADIHAKNMNEETPLYCLLKYGSLTLESFEFFLKYDCSLNFLTETNEYRQDIINYIMRVETSNEWQLILEKMMQVNEVIFAIAGGFNIIQCIVANDDNDLTFDNYLSIFEMAIDIGCNLDQQDKNGKTALHTAVSVYNFEAIIALLQLGADINITDNEERSPFTNEYIASAGDDNESWEINCVKVLAFYVWKMRFIGLKVNESNLRSLESVEERFSLIALLEKDCQLELTKAEETEIYQRLTVKDFLSELGAVAEYPRMGPLRIDVVDKFFKSYADLRHEFPHFCGLLSLQYKKAFARFELWQPAINIIASIIFPAQLPDLCLEAILRYFTNDEIKFLIELEEKLR